jgi:hypothetical protein
MQVQAAIADARVAVGHLIVAVSGRSCLDHPGSMSFALKTGAAAGAARNLISDLAASAFLLALDTHAMKTR